jgi:hypothetical protein
MIIVRPGESLEQHRDEVVIYRLQFDVWSADMDKPDDKAASIRVESKRGVNPLAVKVQPYQNGTKCHDIRITGGSKNGIYEIVRMVKSPTETRRRSFTVAVR